MKKYKIKVNNQFEFEFNTAELAALDVVIQHDELHLLTNQVTHKAKMVDEDFYQKTYTIQVNGQSYVVKIEDEMDQQIKAMGFTLSSSKEINEIKAPMPGLILDVLVKEGQEVEENEAVLILEAMKMENSLASPRTGKIKSISVDKGATVDKGELLIVFEN